MYFPGNEVVFSYRTDRECKKSDRITVPVTSYGKLSVKDIGAGNGPSLVERRKGAPKISLTLFFCLYSFLHHFLKMLCSFQVAGF